MPRSVERPTKKKQSQPEAPLPAWKGLDPLLNEQMIYDGLTLGPQLPEAFRSIFFYATLACYDRKVTRDFMLEWLGAVQGAIETLNSMGLRVNDYMHKHQATAKGRAKLKPGNEIVDPALTTIQAQFSAQRKKIGEMFLGVMQCPSSRDSIS